MNSSFSTEQSQIAVETGAQVLVKIITKLYKQNWTAGLYYNYYLHDRAHNLSSSYILMLS